MIMIVNIFVQLFFVFLVIILCLLHTLNAGNVYHERTTQSRFCSIIRTETTALDQKILSKTSRGHGTSVLTILGVLLRLRLPLIL